MFKYNKTNIFIALIDFNDFETPVKSYFDDRASFYLQPNNSKLVKLYAKRNQATLNDDYFKISSAQNKEFFSIDTVQSDFASYSTGIISKTAILLDRNRDLYQRNVFYDFGPIRNDRRFIWTTHLCVRVFNRNDFYTNNAFVSI